MKKSARLLAAMSAFALCSCSAPASSETAPTTFLLTFDANGGVVSTATMEVEEGKAAILPTPTKEGKEFRGWYTGFSGNDAHVDCLTPITKNLSLIAEWNEYDVDFLDGEGGVYESLLAAPGELLSMPLGGPEKEDETHYYHFTGWDFDFATRIHKDYEIHPTFYSEEGRRAIITATSSCFEGELGMSFLMLDSLFGNSPRDYNHSLAELSFGLSYCTTNQEVATAFLEAIGFDNIVFSENYDTPTADSIGFVLAHRKIEEEDIIAIAIRGFDYGSEWANNFKVGEYGEHDGFNSAAYRVKSGLDSYVSSNYAESQKKYWISGYSRAGAVANSLCQKLLANYSETYDEDNMYAYTFESPRGIPLKEAVAWENVFNLVDPCDPIPRLLPEEFGLTRAGIDVLIDGFDVDEALTAVKDDFSIGAFTPDRQNYETESDLTSYVLQKVLSYGQEEYAKYKITGDDSVLLPGSLCSRELYVQNYQTSVMYLLSVVFGVKAETRQAVIDDLKAKMEDGPMALISIILSGQALADYLKPFLDEDGFAYDEEKLVSACEAVPTLIAGPLSGILSLVLAEESQASLYRLIAHHFGEVQYAFLKAFK